MYFSKPWIDGSKPLMTAQKIKPVKKRTSSASQVFHELIFTGRERLRTPQLRIRKNSQIIKRVVKEKGIIYKEPRIQVA